MLSPEELLKPRYKVIADYPSNIHKIGSIIKNDDGAKFDRIRYYGCAKYPHLFKPLQWWEERKPEDMPEYLKHNLGTIHKTANARYHNKFLVIMIENYKAKERGAGWTDVSQLWLSEFLPVTETEYNEYETQLNKP